MIGLSLRTIGLQENGYLKVLFNNLNNLTLKDALNAIDMAKSNRRSCEDMDSDKSLQNMSPLIENRHGIAPKIHEEICPVISDKAVTGDSNRGRDICLNNESFVSDRQLHVWRLPDETTNWSEKVQLPDSFYEITQDDARYLAASQRRQIAQLENMPFRTQAMRDKEQTALERAYPKAIIRIRFPDQLYIQGEFDSLETGTLFL